MQAGYRSLPSPPPKMLAVFVSFFHYWQPRVCFGLLSELQALAELLGAYGMKYLGQKMMQQIASQVGEIKVFKHLF